MPPDEKEEIMGDYTVKGLKDWLGQFSDDLQVSYRMDCFHGLVTLVVSNGVSEATLQL